MEEDRAAAMATRLRRTAERHGLSAEDAARVVAGYEAAMRRRRAIFADQEHPDFLHPARTALILLDDVGLLDPDALLAATNYDSGSAAIPASTDDLAELGTPRARAILAALPGARLDEATRLEHLVVAAREVQLIALAERLDHARHLHLAPREKWRSFHDGVIAVYQPLAERTDATLARRFRWWSRTFERRFLAAEPP